MTPDELAGLEPKALAEEFLDACKRIEQALKARSPKAAEARGLGEAIQRSGANPQVRINRSALELFADLRNVLSHHAYRDGVPIATPLPDTVALAQRLAAEFERPRAIADVLPGNVRVAEFDDPVVGHLQTMLAEDFSQLPVRRDGRLIAALTTNSIARWVAAHMDENGSALLEEATVGEVLGFVEDDERLAFAPRRSPVADVVDKLSGPEAARIVVVTELGKATQKPIAVATAADLPRLYRIVEGHSAGL